MIKIPKFIGHRGAPGFAPENTLASMRIAKKCGAQWVEFDVKETKDDVLVVMHDDDVKRTTNGQGLVANMTLAEIKKLDSGRWFDLMFAGEKVPTLEEMFHVLAEQNLCANIEIKPCQNTDARLLAKNVVHFVQKHWPHKLPPPLVSCFNIDALYVVREEDSNVHIGLLFEELPKNWKQLAHDLRGSAFCLNHKYLVNAGTLIEEIHKEGYAVLAYTVNDIQTAHELYAMGIDSVFTNYPGSI